MCNPCDSKAALLLERWPEKKHSAAYFAQPGFHRHGVEQKDGSARDVYPPWARVCLIYMKGILLSSGRHSGGNALGAAGGEGSGGCRARGLSVLPAPSSGTPRVPGLEIQGNAPVVSPKSMDVSRLVAVIFPGWVGARGHRWTPGLAGAAARLLLLFCEGRENRCAYFCFGFPICVTHVTAE